MTPIRDVLGAVDGMSIRQLEHHIQERAEVVDRLRAEQAILVPHLDRKWRQFIRDQAGPAGSGQSIALEVKLG